MNYKFELGTTKTGYPQHSFVVVTDELTDARVIDIANYLIENCQVIFDRVATAGEDIMCPIVIRTCVGLTITEETFWHMVCDLGDCAQDLIIGYIAALNRCADKTRYGDLIYSDEYHFIGSYAICPYLDRYFYKDECDTCVATKVYRCFIDFIKHCDLDFETFQEEYIFQVLEKLSFLEQSMYIELACYRLFNGQVQCYDSLQLASMLTNARGNGYLLKQFIDYITDPAYEVDHQLNDDPKIYYRFCAAIYGHNMSKTQEVIDYVQQRLGKKLAHLTEREEEDLRKRRDVQDFYRSLYKSHHKYLDSSFHLYDTEQQKWLNYDEVEEYSR